MRSSSDCADSPVLVLQDENDVTPRSVVSGKLGVHVLSSAKAVREHEQRPPLVGVRRWEQAGVAVDVREEGLRVGDEQAESRVEEMFGHA